MLLFEKHKFVVLDSWRGLCALCVAIFHFRHNVQSHVTDLPFITNSFLFVDFFFVLSGFIIFANYEQKLKEGYSFWKFMLLRFGRIYPLHFFVFIGLIGLECLQIILPQLQNYTKYGPFQGPDSLPHMIPPNLFLLHSMGITERLSFNGPSWSISAEFYAYAFFAILVILFRRHVGYILPMVMLVTGLALFEDNIYLTTTFQYGVLRCLYGFALGALIWKFYAKYNGEIKNDKIAWSVLEIAMVLNVIIGVSSAGTGPWTMLMPFAFAWTILIFSFQGGLISKFLSHQIFIILGALSYSIYMLHAPIAGKFDTILNIVKLDRTNIWMGDLIVLSFLTVTIAGAIFTYLLVEMPGRNYFRRFAKRMPDEQTSLDKAAPV